MNLLWLVSKYPNSLNPVDGAFHIDIVESLAKKGIDISVVAPVPYIPPFIPALSKKIKIYKQLPYYEYQSDIKIYRPGYFGYYKHLHYGAIHKFMFFAVKNIFRKESRQSCNQKPDLIHAHFAYPFGLLAMKLSKLWNVPYLLTLHGTDVNEYPLYNKISFNRFQKAIHNASTVIAVSKALSERTEALTGRKPKVIPIGINLNNYVNFPSGSVLRKRLKLPQDNFIVLFVGQYIEKKAIKILLKAISTLGQKNVLGVFCGDGPLNDLINSSTGIISLGSQSHEMIPLIMSAANLLVLPSYDEGMPTVLIEAGAAGLPVIATNVGGIPDLLAYGRGLLIEPGSVKAIVEAINKVRSDYQSALQRTGKLKKYVELYYNSDKNAEIILKEYKKILSQE